MKKPIFLFLLIVLMTALIFKDAIVTNYLAAKLCSSNPNAKPYIKNTVEFPESVYWEDNIYPGYDYLDRVLMIRNHLDGVHVKSMALNSPDGKVHWYDSKESDWIKSQAIEDGRAEGDYFKTLREEAELIEQRGMVYEVNNMPSVNYKVVFRPVSLSDYEKKYLWADEVEIINSINKEVIGYNKRVMRKWYWFFPDVSVGNRYFYPEPLCGDGNTVRFDEVIFFESARKIFPSKHRKLLNQLLKEKEF